MMNPNGFYKGKLLNLNSSSLIYSFAELLAKIWLPWQGKMFYSETKEGDNVIFGKHKFPFKFYKGKSLDGAKTEVMILDYNLPENPTKVRKVIDELVLTKKNYYLGKAYIKKGKDYKLVANFSLEK